MNPRASDRVRGFQDTIITVGDVRNVRVIFGAILGAEIIIYDNYFNQREFTYSVLY